MNPEFDVASFVVTDELLLAVADFVAATAWSGRTFQYSPPTTNHPAADEALRRVAELLSGLPARYSSNFSLIADHALQGAVDTMYADRVETEADGS